MNKEKWNRLSYADQVSNVGSEISRAIRCKKAGKKVRSMQRYEYALQLIDLTKKDLKNEEKFHELRMAEWKLREYMSDENNEISEENIMEFWDSEIENFLKAKCK